MAIGAASPPAWAVPLPDPKEARLNELVLTIEEKTRASEWEAAESLVREMASLDSDHPKVYLRAVLLSRDRRQPDQALVLMDALCPKDGPGRAYGDALLSFFAGKYDDARKGFERSLGIYESRGHPAGQAACHTMLVNLAKRNADYATAALHLDAAETLLERMGDQAGLADTLLVRAEVLLTDKRPEQGAIAAAKSVELRTAIGGPRDLARSLIILGRCQRAMGQRPAALDSFGRALDLRKQAQDRAAEGSTESEIALVYTDAGDFEQALVHQRRSLALAEEVGDKREVALQHRNLADMLVAAGRPREAVPSFEKAAAIYGELKNPSNEARALVALGKTWSDLGELRQARRAFEPALVKSRAAKDRRAEASALTGLGNLALASGDLAHGLLFENEALPIHREVKDVPGELSSLNNLGASYLRLGDRIQARRHIEAALAAAIKAESRSGEAQASNNLAVLDGVEKSYSRALDEARRAESLWKETGDVRRSALSRANAAEMLLRLGRPNEARPLVDSALADFEKMGNPEAEAYAWNLRGELRLAAGSGPQALAAHRKALELARDADSPEERTRAHAGIAAAQEAVHARGEALGAMRAALDEVEHVRAGLLTGEMKMRFFAGWVDLYERTIALTLPPPMKAARNARVPTPSEIASAFSTVERSRARGLLDALARTEVPSKEIAAGDGERRSVEARDTLGEALARLARATSKASRAEARREVDKARADLERTELQIRAGSDSATSKQHAEARPVTLAALQSGVLRDDEVLLEYFVGESEAWVFTISKRGASVKSLPPPREIAEKAGALLAIEIGGGSEAQGADEAARKERAAAQALATLVLPNPLGKGPRLLLALDGPLWHVPFDALRTQDGPLLQTRDIAVVPSAATLALLRSSRNRTAQGSREQVSGFLGVADPAPGTRTGEDALPPLPFARREVVGVASLFPEAKRRLLVGAEATRAKVLDAGLEHFRFIHFATHAWLDAESPRDTGLRLGAEPSGGGGTFLGVDDIRSLSLSSDLVVLSACSSGAGEALRGEGITGLTRAFLNAGARAVVVSLWDVPDRSTSDFMRDFYQRLVSGQDPAAALAETKRQLVAKSGTQGDQALRSAPFILVGDSGRASPGSNVAAPGTTH